MDGQIKDSNCMVYARTLMLINDTWNRIYGLFYDNDQLG